MTRRATEPTSCSSGTIKQTGSRLNSRSRSQSEEVTASISLTTKVDKNCASHSQTKQHLADHSPKKLDSEREPKEETEDQRTESTCSVLKKRMAKMETKTRAKFEKLLANITCQTPDSSKPLKDSSDQKDQQKKEKICVDKASKSKAEMPKPEKPQGEEAVLSQTMESLFNDQFNCSPETSLAVSSRQEEGVRKRGRKSADLEEYCQKTQKSIDELKLKLEKKNISEKEKKQLRNRVSAY